MSSKFPQLYYEAKIYKYLSSFGPVTGLPKVSPPNSDPRLHNWGAVQRDADGPAGAESGGSVQRPGQAALNKDGAADRGPDDR